MQTIRWILPDGEGMRYMRRIFVVSTCMGAVFMMTLPWLMGSKLSLVEYYLNHSSDYVFIMPFAIICIGLPIIEWFYYFTIARTAIGVGEKSLAVRKGKKVIIGDVGQVEYTKQGVAVNGVSLVLNTRALSGRYLPIYNAEAYSEYVTPLLEESTRVSVLRMAWLHASSLNVRYVAMAMMTVLFVLFAIAS